MKINLLGQLSHFRVAFLSMGENRQHARMTFVGEKVQAVETQLKGRRLADRSQSFLNGSQVLLGLLADELQR